MNKEHATRRGIFLHPLAIAVSYFLMVGLGGPMPAPARQPGNERTATAGKVGNSGLPMASYLRFDGVRSYVEIPSSNVFSLSAGGGITVSAWIRPATLNFPSTEGSGYVHWMGKGEKGRYEWVFRMYSQGNAENRGNRISFYVFNAQGGEGVGSYFEDAIVPGQWIHVVGVADSQRTYMYKNGELRRCDQYRGSGDGTCVKHPIQVDPEAGSAPVRIGTRDLKSFFKGDIREVRIWDRALTGSEISGLYSRRSVPPKGLAAEYLLTNGTARDTTGAHNGAIFGASWIPQT